MGRGHTKAKVRDISKSLGTTNSQCLSTLENAYSQVITSIESTAQDHSTLSDVLVAQVADAMKALEKKHGDMKAKVFLSSLEY